jgi:hypothetical protein
VGAAAGRQAQVLTEGAWAEARKALAPGRNDIAEMGQLSHEGQLRRRYWSYPQMITRAEDNGIEVTDDTIA